MAFYGPTCEAPLERSALLEVAPPSLSNLNRGCARREQRQPRDAGQRQAQGQHRHLRHRPLRPRAVAGVLPPAAAPPRWAHVAATCAQEDKAEQLVSALREHVGECHPRPCCRWRRAAAAGHRCGLPLPGPVGAQAPLRPLGASAVTAQLVGRTRRSLGLPTDSRGAWRGADKLRTWKSIRRTPRSAVPSAAPPPRPAPTQAPTQAPVRPAQTRGATC